MFAIRRDLSADVRTESLQDGKNGLAVMSCVYHRLSRGLETLVARHGAVFSHLRQHLVHDAAMHIRQPAFDAVVVEAQPFVIQAE